MKQKRQTRCPKPSATRWIGVLLLAALIGLAGVNAAGGKKLRLMVTLLPLHHFVQQIVGQRATPVLLADPHHGCLHDYALTPDDVTRIKSSDLLVMNGGGMEHGALDEVLKTVPASQRVVVAELFVEAAGQNPHFFSNPHLAARQLTFLAERIAARDTVNAAFFKQQAAAYVQRLQPLLRRFDAVAGALNQVAAVSVRPSIDPLAGAAGFSLIPLFRDADEVTPTAEQLRKAPGVFKAKRVRAILVDPNFPSRYAVGLSKQTGVPILNLDPGVAAEEVDHRVPDDYYIDTMRRNLQRLEQFAQAVKGPDHD